MRLSLPPHPQLSVIPHLRNRRTEGHCPSKQSDWFKYFSDDRLDFMKQRVRKESGLQKLEPESYREYQQRHAVIFNL
jgi:hypothetical protein